VNGRAIRVVSLVPSVTESLLAWGVVPIAVTRFCEQPSLRAVGGTKDPDIAAIVALQPDLVVVNDEENRREDAVQLESEGMTLHVTRVRALADVGPCLEALADAVGVRYHAGRFMAGAAMTHSRAFVPIWRRPWMTMNADTYGSSVLATVGIANVYADESERYPTITLLDARDRVPDLVVAPSEPYPFGARHVRELETVAADVRLVDGRDLFWWGTRSAGAVERLREALG
jgi:ABC-type Fe3+-hydroxamate transport system substrate-binding protein